MIEGGSPPEGDDPISTRLRVLHSQLHAQRDEAGRLRSAIRAVNAVLADLARMHFDPKLPASLGDAEIEAAFAGLEMLSEELAHAQSAMLHERDRAVAANRAKSFFLANMSHELRTPLNAILGYAELISDELEGDAVASDDLDRIVVAGRQLLGLIDAVLDLSRIEAGVQSYHLETVLPLRLLHEVEIAVAPIVHQQGNRLEIDVRTGAGVRADPLRLRQILVNLVANAAKFTVDGNIQVRVDEIDHRIWFSISDTGIGMTDEVMQSIFLPFVQGDTRPGTGGGSGLGLAIAREHARAMEGEIEVESRPGEGSVFRLRLPAA